MRTKIIAGNLVAVLVVGLVSYVVVSRQIRTAFASEVDVRLGTDREVFERSWRLSGLELLDAVRTQAREEASRALFTSVQENNRRERARARADQVASWLEQRTRTRPEVVAVTDARGVVIARNQDIRRMHGDDLHEPLRTTMTEALRSGEGALDVWAFSEGQQKLLQTAIVPIRGETGQVVGTIVAGFDMSNGMASRHAELLSRDVAFVNQRAVYSSSLDGGAAETLRDALFSEAQASTTGAALAGRVSTPWHVQLGADEHVGISGRVPLAPSTAVAYVVLGNRSAQAAKASPVYTILVMTGLGLIIVLVYGFLLGASLLRPIETMEEGVLAAINGRTDVRLNVESAELGGLAYRINQLLNVVTGTPEADDQGRISSPPEAWGEAVGGSDDVHRGAAPAAAPTADDGDAELAATLARESEDAYYERIYQEYVAAKQGVGEDVSSITKERFVQRLQANEASLEKKHGCRMVRFQVQVQDTQVNLRPVIIR